jgi:hypothetical protein
VGWESKIESLKSEEARKNIGAVVAMNRLLGRLDDVDHALSLAMNGDLRTLERINELNRRLSTSTSSTSTSISSSGEEEQTVISRPPHLGSAAASSRGEEEDPLNLLERQRSVERNLTEIEAICQLRQRTLALTKQDFSDLFRDSTSGARSLNTAQVNLIFSALDTSKDGKIQAKEIRKMFTHNKHRDV